MTTAERPKTALVTGASRGLGLALAIALTARGWTVVVDARGAEDLRAATAGLGPGRVLAVPGDVTDEGHLARLASVADGLGGLDLLVHNAGILGPSPQPALADYPLDVLEDVYRANVFAPLRLTQLVLGQLHPGATVLFVSSDAAVEPYEGWGGYGSAKAAVEQLAHILAAEQPGLRIHRVDPGDMNTRMHQEAFPGEDISDRPPPEASVPGLLALVDGDHPSGRYRAADLTPADAAPGVAR
jgi:NAD(P)-dependent dehydrogenase (short-subunit alcohol dehydrogenase family)